MNQLLVKISSKHVGYQCVNDKDEKIYRMGFVKMFFESPYASQIRF